MKNSIDQILTDLYGIDAALKDREAELRQIIQTMLLARPDTEFSESFYQDLRERLLERARITAPRVTDSSRLPGWFAWLNPYGLVATAFILGLLPSLYFYRQISPQDPSMIAGKKSDAADLSPFAPAIIPLNDQAFGERLLSLQPGSQAATGMGGGTATSDAKLIAPEMAAAYEFVYEGEIPLPDATALPVYKRVTNGDGGRRFAQSLTGLGLGVIDAGSFAGLSLQNATLVQNEPYGLMLSVDLLSEQVFLAPHYPEWPNPLQQCWGNGVSPEAAEACQRQNVLAESDIPADGEMIAAAREFLTRHGVDAAAYGEPFVSHDWRVFYDQAAERSARSPEGPASMPVLPIPEQIPVVFPLMFDGQPVYEGARGQFGIFVNYDIRAKRIAGLNNLMTRRYQQSDYPVVKDKAALSEMLKNGGLYGGMPGEGEKKQIRLGEPQQALVRHVTFDEQGVNELVIPVLIFAVPQADGILFQDKVVLPLVDGIELSLPQIMPLTDDMPVKAAPPKG